MKKRILLVDDEAGIRASLKMVLEPVYDTVAARNAREGLEAVRREAPSLVLLDIMMPGEDGLALLQTMRAEHPGIPVVMLTAINTVKTAVDAMRLGAADYVTKPFDTEELCLIVERALAVQALEREVHYLRAQVGERYALHHLIGDSAAIRDVHVQIAQFADTSLTVLITGESGTGKELVARALHYNSARRHHALIALNCAAIPETLIESELFGHEKGAFTGADSRRIGHFELAHGGSLFLDEITELSPSTQAKLLRALQQREFTRIGGAQPITVDVRIIAATNKDPETLLRRGELREDIYYRLNVASIHLPPLRERREDIPLLAQHFLAKHRTDGQRTAREFSADALEALMRHDWPGNVRELENVVEQASVWCREATIQVSHLPAPLQPKTQPESPADVPPHDGVPLEQAVIELERKKILDALRRTDYVQTHAAGLLGISRRMLKYRMDLLGIAPHEQQGQKERGAMWH